MEHKIFKEGQKVFIVRRDTRLPFTILSGNIVKDYPTSKRYSVLFDFGKLFNHPKEEREHLVKRFHDYNETFETLQEAYLEAMQIFDNNILDTERRRKEFIKEIEALNYKKSEVTSQ